MKRLFIVAALVAGFSVTVLSGAAMAYGYNSHGGSVGHSSYNSHGWNNSQVYHGNYRGNYGYSRGYGCNPRVSIGTRFGYGGYGFSSGYGHGNCGYGW